MPEPSELRVSDQERERGVEEIREHFAAGRLTEEELDARVQGVYEARTRGELEVLRADLPALPATRDQQRAELVERRSHLQRQLLQQAGGSLGAFALCTVIWLATGAHGMFWPVWVALAAVLAFARNGWRLYGPAPELDRVEEDLARRRRHDQRRERRDHRRHR
jgi:Domain of unknown function (DUF1707)